MIAYLKGTLIQKTTSQVILDIGGVGYRASIPLSTYLKLGDVDDAAELHIYTHVTDSALALYGFFTEKEKNLFLKLINISGIGPKIALNVLSGMTVASFRGAVAAGDAKSLSQISGVGRKTAERIVVELKDKIGVSGAWEASSERHGLSVEDQKANDAALALLALGFKQTEAQEAVRRATAALGARAGLEEIVRACLKKGG